VGYYKTTAVSYGLHAGVQKFGYALFFMSDAALQHLSRSDGWEVGVGPSVVVLDEGMAKTLSTTTLRDDVYAFVFGIYADFAPLLINHARDLYAADDLGSSWRARCMPWMPPPSICARPYSLGRRCAPRKPP
jgi:hypothetical protein